jgi:hypothetical protein
MTAPIADTSATGEPETPPNSVQATTLDMPRPPRTWPNIEALGEADDAVGDAAVQHQVAGEDEERDRQEREHGFMPGRSSAGSRPRAGGPRTGWWPDDDSPIAKATGTPRSRKSSERSRRGWSVPRRLAPSVPLRGPIARGEWHGSERGQCHAGSTSSPLSSARMCSIENIATGTPVQRRRCVLEGLGHAQGRDVVAHRPTRAPAAAHCHAISDAEQSATSAWIRISIFGSHASRAPARAATPCPMCPASRTPTAACRASSRRARAAARALSAQVGVSLIT